jgi:molecular chaperone DnaJ
MSASVTAFEQGMGGGVHGFGADFGSAFSDIFEGIFGRAVRDSAPRAAARRGPPLQHGITLEDAYSGKTAQMRRRPR